MWRRLELVSTDVSEERRFTQALHGATSQKTAFFIVTAVKTSNLTHKAHFPIADLSSNKCPIVAHVGSRGNVFTESLTSNGSMRHNILSVPEIILLLSTTQSYFHMKIIVFWDVTPCNLVIISSEMLVSNHQLQSITSQKTVQCSYSPTWEIPVSVFSRSCTRSIKSLSTIEC
jgi:hypothetical protein